MISCPQCQTANPAGTEFCEGCGGRLSAPGRPPTDQGCPYCGTIGQAGDQFCYGCGRPLEDASGSTDDPIAPAPTHSTDTTPSAGAGAATTLLDRTPSPTPSTPTPAGPIQARLLVQGPEGEQRIEFQGQDLLCGRRDTRTRVFPDLELDDSAASRRHLMLFQEDGRLWAQDLESGNGTIRNSTLMPPGEPQELRDGDVFKIGRRYVLKLRIE